MEPLDQLDLIAEVSVALLGFVAVFLALSKKDGKFTESDRHFIQALIMCSALAIVFALMPRAFGLFSDTSAIWILATRIAFALGLTTMVLQGYQQLRMTREEAAQIHWIWHLVAWGLGIAVGVAFLLGLLNNDQVVAYYVAGVTLLVPLSLWVFVGVIFRRFF